MKVETERRRLKSPTNRRNLVRLNQVRIKAPLPRRHRNVVIIQLMAGLFFSCFFFFFCYLLGNLNSLPKNRKILIQVRQKFGRSETSFLKSTCLSESRSRFIPTFANVFQSFYSFLLFLIELNL